MRARLSRLSRLEGWWARAAPFSVWMSQQILDRSAFVVFSSSSAFPAISGVQVEGAQDMGVTGQENVGDVVELK